MTVGEISLDRALVEAFLLDVLCVSVTQHLDLIAIKADGLMSADLRFCFSSNFSSLPII